MVNLNYDNKYSINKQNTQHTQRYKIKKGKHINQRQGVFLMETNFNYLYSNVLFLIPNLWYEHMASLGISENKDILQGNIIFWDNNKKKRKFTIIFWGNEIK